MFHASRTPNVTAATDSAIRMFRVFSSIILLPAAQQHVKANIDQEHAEQDRAHRPGPARPPASLAHRQHPTPPGNSQ
jgi:hypothetical protein